MSEAQDSSQDTPQSPEEGAKRPVVFLFDETPSPPASDPPKEEPKPEKPEPQSPRRLISLDAYRGFVMLAMASGALGFAEIVRQYGTTSRPDPGFVGYVDGTWFQSVWLPAWHFLAYQFSHVAWVGCSFWDLIQPSFMFIVGAAMPFSFAKRVAQGQSPARRFAHVLFRAVLLIALGVLLSSNKSSFSQTKFTFVNVLSQIGLGYVFVYLLMGRRFGVQVLAAAVILVGYWFAFYQYEPAVNEPGGVEAYLQAYRPNQDYPKQEAADFGRTFEEGTLANQWNKHVNFAASFDRQFLNQFHREEPRWPAREGLPPNCKMSFWVDKGGYQTLNFIPSIATILFGVMAGQLLMSRRRRKVLTLLLAGLGCFAVALALDPEMWPEAWRIDGWNSVCPTVKRIWTPTWAIFSTGWTLWLLAAFYWVIDVKGLKAWAFPLKVVGMNSIAMYCMAQLLKPWIWGTVERHLNAFGTVNAHEETIWQLAFGTSNIYGQFWQSVLALFVLWLVVLWMYRNRIFIRI